MLNNLLNLLSKNPLFLALFVGISVQVLKVLIVFFRKRRLELHIFFEAGRMPSSHSASVSALAVSVGMLEGFHSMLFQITAYFCLFVIYDALGVRAAAGRQAKVLNQIIGDFFGDKKSKPGRLKEIIGHTPIEVIVGTIIGIVSGFLFTSMN